MTHEWITDRLPTEADGDGRGDVRVPRRASSKPPGGFYQHYAVVIPGQPWWSDKAALSAEVEPAAALVVAVDQQWRRRNGEVVVIEKIDRNHRYGKTHPFWADGTSYTEKGACCASGEPGHPYDPIELVSGPAPAPAPCLKSLTDDQLQAHFVAVQAETLRRVAARYIVEAKRPGGLLA